MWKLELIRKGSKWREATLFDNTPSAFSFIPARTELPSSRNSPINRFTGADFTHVKSAPFLAVPHLDGEPKPRRQNMRQEA